MKTNAQIIRSESSCQCKKQQTLSFLDYPVGKNEESVIEIQRIRTYAGFVSALISLSKSLVLLRVVGIPPRSTREVPCRNSRCVRRAEDRVWMDREASC